MGGTTRDVPHDLSIGKECPESFGVSLKNFFISLRMNSEVYDPNSDVAIILQGGGFGLQELPDRVKIEEPGLACGVLDTFVADLTSSGPVPKSLRADVVGFSDFRICFISGHNWNQQQMGQLFVRVEGCV